MSNIATSDVRLQQISQWLTTVTPTTKPDTLRPASADASFRRYFRVDGLDGATYIVMDAPPPQEDVGPFIRIADVFGQTGITVPKVMAKDVENGFLLLSDLGNATYLKQLHAGTANSMYGDAFDALVKLQGNSHPGVLPDYDRALLQRELDLFPDWYVSRHCQITLTSEQKTQLQGVFDLILENNLSQPKVYVHRDYHCRNLMVIDEGNPGILDFQDAVYGPITYDLVSLLRDAYIQWDEESVQKWVRSYWNKARAAGLPVRSSFDVFYRDFEFMGLQRHIKVLGIFARLFHRDGKSAYLNDIPLVMEYTRNAAARYPEMAPLLALLDAIEQTPKNTAKFS